MINTTLYKREIKNSLKLLVILAAVMTFYVSIIVYMYEPEMMSLLDSYVEAMPDILAAVGMSSGATDLLGFMISYLYGFILLVFPMIYCILRGNGLLAKYTNNGAMSYLLAAPVPRRTIVFTQITALISGILLLMLYTTALEIGVAEHFFPGELDIAGLLTVNVGLLCLQLFIGSLCLLFSSACSDTKYSLTFGAGIPTLMFILQMLANVGDKAADLKYATFFTLFDPTGLADGDTTAWLCTGILLLAAILCYALTMLIFSRKNFSI
ncbi:MAG: ABC transporter permease subunit [Peptococcaceae bacterium]|nr:ABC transporter permease subunit [Peptococcaceae bacterium]